jgi:membrane protein YdbS with pleckstrin-like domain
MASPSNNGTSPKEYRPSAKAIWFGLTGLLVLGSLLVLRFGFHFLTELKQEFYLFSFCAVLFLFCIWLLVIYYRRKICLYPDKITVHGVFKTKEMKFSEIRKITFYPNGLTDLQIKSEIQKIRISFSCYSLASITRLVLFFHQNFENVETNWKECEETFEGARWLYSLGRIICYVTLALIAIKISLGFSTHDFSDLQDKIGKGIGILMASIALLFIIEKLWKKFRRKQTRIP